MIDSKFIEGSKVYKSLKNLAERFKYKLGVDGPSDDSFFEVQLKAKDNDFSVGILKIDNNYLINDLESSKLPRELYSSRLSNGFSDEQRSDEILKNLELLLSRQLLFYSRPRFLNQKAGYISLLIDGTPRNINLKSNTLGLKAE